MPMQNLRRTDQWGLLPPPGPHIASAFGDTDRRRIFRPKTISAENVLAETFSVEDVFRLEKFSIEENFARKSFRPKMFAAERVLGRIFFRPKHFSEIFNRKCFRPKNCRPKTFFIRKCFRPKKNWPKTFSAGYFSSAEKFVARQVFGRYFFSAEKFSVFDRVQLNTEHTEHNDFAAFLNC